MTDIEPTMSLPEAQNWLRERVDKGERCPCCSQFSKVYRRQLTSSTGRILIAMYNKAYNDWIDVPGLAATLVTYHTRSTGGDEAKARYWNLIEAMPNVRRDDGSDRVGWWRLTAQGISFVRNEIVIAKHARIYDGRCLGLDNTQLVSIIDVLGKRFNYRELMDGL